MADEVKTTIEEPEWAKELNAVVAAEESENNVPAPLSEEEQYAIIKQEAPEEHQGVLNTLMELNKTASVLAKIDSEEQIEQRNKVLNMVMEGFIQKRYMSNLKLEDLKEKLIQSVSDNIDNLDLVTQIDTLEKIHNITVVDAQRASGLGNGVGAGMNGAPGVQINLNNASNGGTVEATTNTMTIGAGVTAENLKDVASLSATMKSMKESGAPRKVNNEAQPATDAEFTEGK